MCIFQVVQFEISKRMSPQELRVTADRRGDRVFDARPDYDILANAERLYSVFWLNDGVETARCDARCADEAVELIAERFGLRADDLAALPISRYE